MFWPSATMIRWSNQVWKPIQLDYSIQSNRSNRQSNSPAADYSSHMNLPDQMVNQSPTVDSSFNRITFRWLNTRRIWPEPSALAVADGIHHTISRPDTERIPSCCRRTLTWVEKSRFSDRRRRVFGLYDAGDANDVDMLTADRPFSLSLSLYLYLSIFLSFSLSLFLSLSLLSLRSPLPETHTQKYFKTRTVALGL